LKTLANWKFINLKRNVSMLATISGAGPMTGFKQWWGMIQAFHKMATAGGQIEVGTLSEGIYTCDDNSCWFGRWNYSLRWIQSSE
jgi:biopolymer transport protein ExbB/TolQ